MARIVTFDLSQVLIYEVQAAMLALLAFPEDAPGSARHAEAQVALVSHMYRSDAAADPAFAHQLITTRWVYMAADENKLTTLVARTYERLRRSQIALRILRPFVQQALFGEDAPPLPANLSQLSLNAVTEWVTERSPGERDAHVFEQKVVRKLYPVAHLGMALEMILHQAEQVTGQPLKAETLMTSPELTRDMVALAEQLEPVLLGIEQFAVVEETQVRIRLLG